MTKLLVSVRNVYEAQMAAAVGVDIIDIKEPHHGSLGAVDQQVLNEIASQTDIQVPLSAALGELTAFESCPIKCATGLKYAKFGLAKCAERTDWQTQLAAAIESLSVNTQAIAVVYADWQAAKAPAPEEVLKVAKQLSCPGILVDTYFKQSGSLTNLWSLQQINQWIQQVQQADLFCALAGSLTLDSLAELLPLKPEVLGVRGAACKNQRDSDIDQNKLETLVNLVHSTKLKTQAIQL